MKQVSSRAAIQNRPISGEVGSKPSLWSNVHPDTKQPARKPGRVYEVRFGLGETNMKENHRLRDERGVALVLVLFVALVVGSISAGAALMSSSASLVQRYSDRQSTLVSAADAGIEETRSRVNGDNDLYPADGYSTLESAAPVYNADGSLIPGVKRWLYAGPTGITSGQYGVFGSIVSVVEDNTGNKTIRRGEVAQESFAKYAYFTDVEPSNISFGGGDQIQGPVHTNDYLKIYSSGATFLGEVSTAKTVEGEEYGTFAEGYTEYGPRIEMPATAELTKLNVQASAGGTAFVSTSQGNQGEATMRIDFRPVDINGDGQFNGENEGFIRVYSAPGNAPYVVAMRPTSGNGLERSENCGHYENDGSFRVADDHPSSGSDDWYDAVRDTDRRCYLGGDDSLFGGFVADGGPGEWLPYPGAVSPVLTGLVGAEAQYLFPINRQFNPSFKGVIYVDGKVAIGGTLRGRVTVAATDDIIIADDIVYATNPGAGTCNDILGLFAGDDVIISDNTLNAPQRPDNDDNHRTYDDTKDEFIQGVVLALGIFTVANYSSSAHSSNDEACEATTWGRGCLYLTGGIIQATRGAVGQGNGNGYLKRYSYDQCAYSSPPPYFPTTGHFERGRYYEVNPVGFSIGSYWQSLVPAAP